MPGPAVKTATPLEGELLSFICCEGLLLALACPPIADAAGDLRKGDERDNQRGEAGEH